MSVLHRWQWNTFVQVKKFSCKVFSPSSWFIWTLLWKNIDLFETISVSWFIFKFSSLTILHFCILVIRIRCYVKTRSPSSKNIWIHAQFYLIQCICYRSPCAMANLNLEFNLILFNSKNMLNYKVYNLNALPKNF